MFVKPGKIEGNFLNKFTSSFAATRSKEWIFPQLEAMARARRASPQPKSATTGFPDLKQRWIGGFVNWIVFWIFRHQRSAIKSGHWQRSEIKLINSKAAVIRDPTRLKNYYHEYTQTRKQSRVILHFDNGVNDDV